MTTTQQATAGALRLARSAAIADAGVLACPYPADATGPRSAARRVWLGEYLRLRPPALDAVDYGDAVTALAHGLDTAGDGGPASDRPELNLFGTPA
jgi:hypothetical protein